MLTEADARELRPSKRSFVHWIVAGTALALLLAVVIAAGTIWWRTFELMLLHHDVRNIGTALHQYHDTYGQFPPPFVYDRDGNRMHSWRALIELHLPAATDGDGPISTYRFSEPWNSPHNLAASKGHKFANYPITFLAVVGPNAAWSEAGTRKIKDFSDGTWNTALVIAVKGVDVPWYEPRDLTFDGTHLSLEANGAKQRMSLSQCFILTADGAVRYIQDALKDEMVKPLITFNAGDEQPKSFW